MTLNTPILFLIFNRPKTTQKVFDAILKAKPKKLYVAADGPRKNKIGEKELCEVTRAIIKQVDWPCKVKTLFRKENLGCGKAVSLGITWFFDNEKMGIILEDDCLPDPSFFPYCKNLLEKYKDNEKVMMISGDNFISEKVKLKESYYFSRYCHIWGWASWRRAWKKYDYNMLKWPEFESCGKINSYFSSFEERFFWERTFDLAYRHKISSWDAQWGFACLSNEGCAINPSVNLVSNIGFGDDSTHTFGSNPIFSALRVKPILNIIHPKRISVDEKTDYTSFKLIFGKSNLELTRLVFMEFCKKIVRLIEGIF